MVYLADKYGAFIPKDPRRRAECMSWVMWQMAGQVSGTSLTSQSWRHSVRWDSLPTELPI